MAIRASAPGVIKLLGEHAVVYGYTCIAAAVNLYVHSDVSSNKDEDSLEIINVCPDESRIVLRKEQLLDLFDRYGYKSSVADYVNNVPNIRPDYLHYATIAAKLYCRHGINVFGKTVRLTGDLPVQKGLASSAASSTAFTVSLIANAKHPREDEIIDTARDGDRVIHKNLQAGKIDVSTSFYGGCISYNARAGAKKEGDGKGMTLMVVDTGPKKSTAEMVGKVASMYENDRRTAEGIFKHINECSIKGIAALKKGDARTLGNCMYVDHELLQQLGVSSPNLDRLVDIAKDRGALGAKLSGGGGGGIAVVLTGRSTQLDDMQKDFMREGFDVLNAGVSTSGAYGFLAPKIQNSVTQANISRR
jgi:mevalonate kinase